MIPLSGNVEEKDHTEYPHQNVIVKMLTSLGPKDFGAPWQPSHLV